MSRAQEGLSTMTTKTPARRGSESRRRQVAAIRAAEARRRRTRRMVLWAGALIAVVAVLTAMMVSARPKSDAAARTAPNFTLIDTAGKTVSLADYRGKPVVLYFSEGAGCQSCLTQMADIERHSSDFAKAGITMLPIVMNSAEQIRADMAQEGVRTPFLLDTSGSVSKAYGTLGKGMHAGLPGHSFVLIDATGVQRWYGEYPSMFLPSADLLIQVRKHLPTQ
jgi:peroxiredoxin